MEVPPPAQLKNILGELGKAGAGAGTGEGESAAGAAGGGAAAPSLVSERASDRSVCLERLRGGLWRFQDLMVCLYPVNQ